MDFRQLEYFVEVVNQNSFSLAADRLKVSQPAVSAQIKQLERELGVALLIRSARHLHMTAAGRRFYDGAVGILAQVSRLRESFRQTDLNQLRLGVSTIPAAYILPDLLKIYREQLPATQIIAEERNSRAIIDAVADRELHAGIVGMKIETDSCRFEPIYVDRFVLIAPPTDDYRAMLKSEPDLKRLLRSVPMIVREPGSGTKKNMGAILMEVGLSESDLNRVATVNDVEVTKRLVRMGIGCSLVSNIAVVDEVRRRELLAHPLSCLKHAEREIYLVTNRSAHLSGDLEAFVRLLKSSAWMPAGRKMEIG